MEDLLQNPWRFFGVVASKQSYINLFYLFASFPLGVFYFVFLISGLSTGISLSIIWVGIPILLLMGVAWWGLARFERQLAVHFLKEDIPKIVNTSFSKESILLQMKERIANPITWKSLLYLFLKFPMGIVTFIVLVTVVSLTLSLLAMPLIYEFMPFDEIGIFIGGDFPDWRIDSLGDATVAALIGVLLLPVTLHISNVLAWVHGKFAKIMLSNEPLVS